MSRTSRTRRRARAAVVIGLAALAVLQLGLAVVMEWWAPGLRDPEYGAKLALLRQRLAERPGRPLVLVLGSSRVTVGLRPDTTRELVDGPVVFNFGLLGASPVMQHVVLRRLLRHGVRPSCVLFEVWPPLLQQVPRAGDEIRLGVARFGWGDAWLLHGYAEDPAEFSRRWWPGGLCPWLVHRAVLIGQAVPALAPAADPWSNFEADGWRGMSWNCPPAQARECSEQARGRYRTALPAWALNTHADRSLRDAVACCRRAGIAAALLFLPESRQFQSFYPPPIRTAVDEYLGGLSRECGVPVLDCRDLADDEAFWDGFHMAPEGAARFSARFAREVLPQLESLRPLPTAVSPHPSSLVP
jgi:hypothetical protein